MPGFKLGRGNWEFRTFDQTSASTFSQGSLVCLAAARTVSAYSGGQAGVLGIAMAGSNNSLPAGKVVVAVPADNCTAFCDVPTGIGASSLSLGESYGIYQSGNFISYITTAAYSAASRVVNVIGAINSANSTIEVALLGNAAQVYSNTSTNIQ